MKPTLARGLERREHVVVDAARSIGFLGAALRVYSTPSMINDMEYACLRLLAEHLDAGESSVGVQVSVNHLGGTPLGQRVELQATITAVDGRRITFDVEARDAVELVGSGTHQRYVIDIDRHAETIRRKGERLTAKET